MAELADALALGASEATREGSSPSLPTKCDGAHAGPGRSSIAQADVSHHSFYEKKREVEAVQAHVTEVNTVSREIEITVPADELKPHFDKKYKEYRPKVDIKGFRKGKAPLDIVIKLYGEMIEQDSLQEVATEFYKQAIKEKDLQPIGEPTLLDMDYKRGEKLMVKIRYDVRPEVTLKKYKGIKVTKPVHTVTEGDVEEEILRLRRMNAAMSEVDAVTNEEHVITVDMQDLDEKGMPIIGKRTQDARFYLADEKLEAPFKEALSRAEKNAEYTVQFDHDHGDHQHTVRSRLSVKKVEKVELPPFDDAFVAKITNEKVSSITAFRADLRRDLETYWKTKSDRAGINALTAELLKLHEFEVPESLVRAVMESLLKDVAGQHPNKELPADFNYDEFWHENLSYAEAQAKWALLREELLKEEQIVVADEDLVALAEREAPKINIDKERLLEYYKTSEQVRDRLIGEKLLDALMAKAKVEEVEDTKLSSGTKG